MNIRLRKDALTLTRGRDNALSLPATDADGYIPDGIAYVRFALVWNGTPQGVIYSTVGAVSADAVTGDSVFAFTLPAQFSQPVCDQCETECFWINPATGVETRFAILPTTMLASGLQDAYTGFSVIAFSQPGQAAVGAMTGGATVVRGTLTGYAFYAAAAPKTTAILANVYADGVLIASGLTLPKDATHAAAVLSSVYTGNLEALTATITQTGAAPDEGTAPVLHLFFIPVRSGG